MGERTGEERREEEREKEEGRGNIFRQVKKKAEGTTSFCRPTIKFSIVLVPLTNYDEVLGPH